MLHRFVTGFGGGSSVARGRQLLFGQKRWVQWRSPYLGLARGTTKGNSSKEFPLWFYLGSCYVCGRLFLSGYWLATMDDEAQVAIYKSQTDAWGADRQLEGLETLASWLESTNTVIGVDATHKLMRLGGDEAIVGGLTSEDERVRAAAFDAFAYVVRDDGLARKIVKKFPGCREAAVAELNRLSTTRPKSSEEWAENHACRLDVLSVLASLTREQEVWGDNTPLDKIVPCLVNVLSESRQAAEMSYAAKSQRVLAQQRESGVGRITVWINELHDSVQQDMIGELVAAALNVAHNVSRLEGGPKIIAETPECLDFLNSLTLSEDPECAFHAYFAANNVLDFVHGYDEKIAFKVRSSGQMVKPAFGQQFYMDPRTALALNRTVEAFAPAQFLLCGAWGALRRIYRFHASGETFVMSTARLPRLALQSAFSTAVITALLSAVYGSRGIRYEFRRAVDWPAGDAYQILLAHLIATADVLAVTLALRAAPYAIVPFLVTNTLLM